MKISRTGTSAVCCALMALLAAPTTLADSIWVTWDIWKNSIQLPNGTTVGIGSGVITIWDCDGQPDTYNWFLEETTMPSQELVFIPPRGCVTVPPGRCIDIPFIVICKGPDISAGPASFRVRAMNKDGSKQELIDTGIVWTRAVNPPIGSPFVPRVELFEPIVRIVEGQTRRIKYVITNTEPFPVVFQAQFAVGLEAQAGVTLENPGPFMVELGASGSLDASAIVEATVSVDPGSPLRAGADVFLGLDFNGDGLVTFPDPAGLPGEVAAAAIVQSEARAADINEDNTVGSADLAQLLGDWGMLIP